MKKIIPTLRYTIAQNSIWWSLLDVESILRRNEIIPRNKDFADLFRKRLSEHILESEHSYFFNCTLCIIPYDEFFNQQKIEIITGILNKEQLVTEKELKLTAALMCENIETLKMRFPSIYEKIKKITFKSNEEGS